MNPSFPSRPFHTRQSLQGSLMAALRSPSLSLFLLLTAAAAAVFTAAPASPASGGNIDFVKSSCSATLYPSLCVQSLSGYSSAVKTSDRRLALAALSVSVSRARSARAYVSRASKAAATAKGKRPYYQAVKDCVEHMGDSVDRLSQSAKELGSMGAGAGEEFAWHVSNVQTWVSAALTDDTTCTDGLSAAQVAAVEARERTDITRVVSDVAKVTSNALALVNRFAQKHRQR